MSTEIKYYIKNIVDSFFNSGTSFDKLNDYNSAVFKIFVKQGALVLYPNNEVTCFKYKNEIYYNPNYPKLADNKVVINLRHLHPSLHKEMDNLIKLTAEVITAKKRFEAYCNRASKYMVERGIQLLETFPPQYWSLVAYGFIIETIPDSFSKSVKLDLESSFEYHIDANSLSRSFVNDLINKMAPIIQDFKDKEQTCVNQLDSFMFTVEVLVF